MGDVNSIVIGIRTASGKNDEFDKKDLKKALFYFDEQNDKAEEVSLLKRILSDEKVFQALDKNHNGTLSADEFVKAAELREPKNVLDNLDLDKAISPRSGSLPPPPPTAETSGTTVPKSGTIPRSGSLPPSPPTVEAPRTAPPQQTSRTPQTSSTVTKPAESRRPSQIQGYVSKGYTNRSPGGVQKTIDICHRKLDDNRTVDMYFEKDNKLHILIYSEENFTSDNCIQEYTIPVEEVHNIGLTDKIRTYFSLTMDDTWNVGDIRNKPQDVPIVALNGNSGENKSLFADFIIDKFLTENNYRTLQQTPGVEFRQARGTDELRESGGFQQPSLKTYEEYSGNIEVLENYFKDFESKYGPIKNKSKTVFTDGQKSHITQLGSYYDADRGDCYTFLILSNPNDLNKSEVTFKEFVILKAELERIAKNDGIKINFDNIEEVRNFLLSHFSDHTDEIGACAKRQAGDAQFGEIQDFLYRGTGDPEDPEDTKIKTKINPADTQDEKARKQREALQAAFTKLIQNKPRNNNSETHKYKSGILKDLHLHLSDYPKEIPIPQTVSEYYAKLNPKKDEAEAAIPSTFEVKGEYKRIIVDKTGIRIVRWKMKNGKPADIKVAFIKKENLTGVYARFTDLTPGFIARAFNSDNPEVKAHYTYLIDRARIYFGHAHFSNETDIEKEIHDIDDEAKKK